MAQGPTVFVVDDDAAVRKSFEWLVDSVDLSIETFDSALAFLEAYDPERPGCLELDVRMPGMNGNQLQEKLNAGGVAIPVIMVTGYGDVPTAVRSMKGGAIDFIEKPFNDQTMLERIKLALERDAKIRRDRGFREQAKSCLRSLTPRETEVMDLVTKGRSNKEVARDLGISPKTVEVHRANVMIKMQAQSLPHLVKIAELCATDR